MHSRSMTTAPCELLLWDSEFFGVRIARLTSREAAALDIEATEAWCRDRRVDCLYYLTESPDEDPALLSRGFVPVDVRVTLEMRLEADGGAVSPGIRVAGPADVPALREIAAVSHSATRFFADPRLRRRAPALYETWIEKSVHGMADAVLIPDVANVVGYITCSTRGGSVGEIGLFAVAPAQRGKGIGGQLLGGALSWFRETGARVVRVVAQGANVPAIAAYERAGFHPVRSQRWYHRWFTTDSP